MDSKAPENMELLKDNVSKEVSPPDTKRSNDLLIRRRWFLATLLVLACDFSLFLSMWYITLAAGEYKVHKARYLGISWTIFAVPLIIISSALFFWWYRGSAFFNRQNAPRWKRVLDIGNGSLCFILVVIYLFVVAIPTYNTPRWEISSDFGSEQVPVPAFAFVVRHSTPRSKYWPFDYENRTEGLPVYATITDTNATVDIPPEGFSTRYVSHPLEGEYTVLIANASTIWQNFTNPLGSTLYLNLRGNWNRSMPGAGDEARRTQIYAFDPRAEVEDIMACGLVPMVDMELFSNSFYQLSLTRMRDNQKMITAPDGYDSICPSVYQHLLTELDPPFSSFDLSLTARPSITAITCDVSDDPDAWCLTSASLKYGSQIISQQQSVPGKSRFSMWTDVGSIVGGVQAIAWFGAQLFGG